MEYWETNIVCDYLTVTCSPQDSSHYSVIDFLVRNGAYLNNDLDYRTDLFFNPLVNMRSRIQITETKTLVKISATGSALSYLRSLSLFDEYLMLLSEVPHNVTRLDAALDVPVDTAKVIGKLKRTYPNGKVHLSRKAASVSEVTRYRDDGVATGTYYIGRRGKNRFIARIYDKQLELLDVHGQLTSFLTRYELEFGRKVGVTLRDAAKPYSVFWNHASPMLLKIPPRLNKWVPSEGDYSFSMGKRAAVLPAVVLQRRVSDSDDLASMFYLAEKLGPLGADTLLQYITARIRQLEQGSVTKVHHDEAV